MDDNNLTGEPMAPITPVVNDGATVPAAAETVATPEGDRGPVDVIATDTHAPPVGSEPLPPDLSGDTLLSSLNVNGAEVQRSITVLPDPLYLANYTRLERAQALPEVPADEPLHEIQYAEGSIEFFVASETDRRRMRIVAARGGFACQYAPEDTEQEVQHG